MTRRFPPGSLPPGVVVVAWWARSSGQQPRRVVQRGQDQIAGLSVGGLGHHRDLQVLAFNAAGPARPSTSPMT